MDSSFSPRLRELIAGRTGLEAAGPVKFPPGFLWGSATASYQIEGAAGEDGRGPSIWDTFSHTPGKVLNGDTGDVACDHYHRWAEDVDLMASLGLQVYRFSIAWPRIFPSGVGAVNKPGLDFYDRLVDRLLERQILPFVTLYHWDLPQALQDQGGWANRSTAEAFVEYTRLVAKRLGDRVKHWITHNEPYVVSWVGNFLGKHAPGLQDQATALQVSHHLLLSHGWAVRTLREVVGPEAQVGITLNLNPVYPVRDTPEDLNAARHTDGQLNRWFLDPLYGRGYPADVWADYGEAVPDVHPGDLEAIAAPTDFLGINNYAPSIVQAEADVRHLSQSVTNPIELLREQGVSFTEMNWPVLPLGLRDLLLRVHQDYRPPAIYITENGCAYADQVQDGQVNDPERVRFLRMHLTSVQAAIQAGVPVKGYFVWSLMDNFEWAWGYSRRFGIIYVDYQTGARIPKASAAFFRQVIASNGLPAQG